MTAADTAPRRPPWWRTVLLVPACMFFTVSSGVFSEVGQNTEGPGAVLLLPLLLGMVAVPLALLWRHRAPLVITWVAVAAGVVLPLGPSTALVALACLIVRRRGPAVWWAAAGVAVTTALAMVRDVLAPSAAASLLQFFALPPGTSSEASVELGWRLPTILALVLMGLSVGTGLLMRARRSSRSAETVARAAGREQDRLGEALARQIERERIAREVHDSLGHRLSLLSLHAGALQANTPAGTELRESAELVREGAGKAMDDLRSLLSVLRQHPDDAAPELSLADLRAVLDDEVATGEPVSSTVYLEQAESADPALARAVYRIVQEMLTNARKHAPGAPVRLSVTGGPAEGICIDARNPYLGSSASSGSRSGLQGVAERAELLGGRIAYGLDDHDRTFRVTVTLPWR
ncbi:histidine kinase [Ruania suaedae]|uniref:sensor histidine kinase n=1 Tax=Ruania suaedae TaxID=2897774 RepID=UPI001E3608F8|nr:histidine kinase [Ruania suaedae]UFU03770.1 histidine kinase [Ruania suaedae]